MTEKKSYITLDNRWTSCNFDKLRKEGSSLSYWVVASEKEGSRPSCDWKLGAQGDWGQQPFSPNRNPHGKAIENPSGLPKPSPRPWLGARSIQPKFRPGPPQKMDQFFRNFSRWTEPIHWVLDRNFRKFWLNGSRPLSPRVIWSFLAVRILLAAHRTLLLFYKLLLVKT